MPDKHTPSQSIVTTAHSGAADATLRPMYMGDLHKVLDIINAHDDDDAEAAEADFHESGFEGQFVLEKDDKVIGVTGYRPVPATDNTYWLSWTYLHKAFRGQGLGKKMTSELIDKLCTQGGRKLFVKVSTYEDPEQGQIYARALKMYQSIGFELEVTSYDFYDIGEDQLILGLILRDKGDATFEDDIEVQDEKPVIRFNGLQEISETEGSYTFLWEVKDTVKLFGKRSFSSDDLIIGLRAVKSDGGRKIFLTFPSNLPLIHKPLQTTGFKYVGQLTNYYEAGVHEMHFTHDLEGL